MKLHGREEEMCGWQTEKRQEAVRAVWRGSQGPHHRDLGDPCGVCNFPMSSGKPLKNFKQGK